MRGLAERSKLEWRTTTNMIIVASSDMMAVYDERKWERVLGGLTEIGNGQGRR
jgi:hypothetical protein